MIKKEFSTQIRANLPDHTDQEQFHRIAYETRIGKWERYWIVKTDLKVFQIFYWNHCALLWRALASGQGFSCPLGKKAFHTVCVYFRSFEVFSSNFRNFLVVTLITLKKKSPKTKKILRNKKIQKTSKKFRKKIKYLKNNFLLQKNCRRKNKNSNNKNLLCFSILGICNSTRAL